MVLRYSSAQGRIEMQNLTIAGNVGKDAILRKTQSGDAVLSWSIAVDNGKDKNGNKRDSTWFECSMWGSRAESLETYITKGSKLVVTGYPTARAYENKVYLGVTVQQLTFMGGGQQRDDQQRQDPQGAYDDEIPF
jgi:single-strand DNA-binding protein